MSAVANTTKSAAPSVLSIRALSIIEAGRYLRSFSIWIVVISVLGVIVLALLAKVRGGFWIGDPPRRTDSATHTLLELLQPPLLVAIVGAAGVAIGPNGSRPPPLPPWTARTRVRCRNPPFDRSTTHAWWPDRRRDGCCLSARDFPLLIIKDVWYAFTPE